MKMAKNMDVMVKMEMLEELTNTIKKLEEKAGEYPILLVEVEKLKEEFARLRNLCPVEMKWEEEMDENPDYNEQNATALPAEIVRIKKEEKLQIYNPEDVDIFYDAVSHLDFQGQVSKDYEDKNVLPMDSEYYLGVKKKTQQRIGRQVSFNLLTSQVLGYNEPCQWKQRNSTHMGPVHCVNRKRKKKRTSQGLSRIELQHVKMKNLQPLLNLFRLLVHYII